MAYTPYRPSNIPRSENQLKKELDAFVEDVTHGQNAGFAFAVYDDEEQTIMERLVKSKRKAKGLEIVRL